MWAAFRLLLDPGLSLPSEDRANSSNHQASSVLRHRGDAGKGGEQTWRRCQLQQSTKAPGLTGAEQQLFLFLSLGVA